MTDAARTALEPWLLEVLACPACRSPLREHAGPESAELLCTGCGRAYPVRDGIPVLLVDEARLTDAEAGSASSPGAPGADAGRADAGTAETGAPDAGTADGRGDAGRPSTAGG